VNPQLSGVAVPDPTSSWIEAGFSVDSGRVRIGDFVVALDQPTDRTAWGFEPPLVAAIDGIPECDVTPAPPATHPNGAVGVDHVVVTSSDLGRTTAALEAVGIALRRSRSLGDREQRFFWAGTTIIEMVGPSTAEGHTHASIWGLALVSNDLEASKERLGPLLSDPRPAVQPGRSIAAIRTRELGISVTIALMTPHEPSQLI